MEQKFKLLTEKLKDERNKKVIFVSHCILNENKRYLGGAFRKGSIDEIIDELQKQGIGIIQMKCPEQKAWGGVLKRKILFGYGIKNSIFNYFRKPYISFFIWNTKRIYRRMAEEVVSDIQNYLNSGFEVVGIIGVKGSPSCGISVALDINKSAEFVASIEIEEIERNSFNEYCFKNCLVAREGLFVKVLKEKLIEKQIDINFIEHDLFSEMKGEKLDFKL